MNNSRPIGDPVTASKWSRSRLLDVALALLLLAASGAWATSFWNTWTARGGQPLFYQYYFEPAVMIACGNGFVISEVQPKPLEDFLWQRRDSFSCDELPPGLKVGRRHLYQEAWTYLQWTVGLSWRVLGISWSGMGPLFGLLFGAVIALAYGIFRLGMGRVLAVACALGFAASSTHLLNLPHLRDYAKAPFTLALVLIMAKLVLSPVSTRSVLGLSAAYGAVLGVGYGFRTDFLVNVPIFAFVLFAFLNGGVSRNLRLKAGALVLFIATLLGASWPAASAVYEKGGCQWHVALLGLQAPFDTYLGIQSAPYDFGYLYDDGYIERIANGYAGRMQPGAEPLVFCSHEYDVQTGGYLRDLALTVPGDLLARALGSALQVVDLPFGHDAPPMPDWAAVVYRVRARLLMLISDSWGAGICLVALIGTAAVSLRLGLFLAVLLLYFTGYPAIQFQGRHYFHLEFITWFALGLVVHHALVAAWSMRTTPAWLRARAVRGALFAAAGLAVIVGGLTAARVYQGRQVRHLLRSYIEAPKVALEPAGDAAAAASQFLEVQLNEQVCGASPSVTFQYDPANPIRNYTRVVTVAPRTQATGPTRIFLPVFPSFLRVEVSDTTPGCLVSVSRLADVRGMPVLLGATLPPDWESLPLYQRLSGWEQD